MAAKALSQCKTLYNGVWPQASCGVRRVLNLYQKHLEDDSAISWLRRTRRPLSSSCLSSSAVSSQAHRVSAAHKAWTICAGTIVKTRHICDSERNAARTVAQSTPATVPAPSKINDTTTAERAKATNKCTINFTLRDGTLKTVEASVGETLLDVAHANDIDVEGACEASLACSTCHVILDPTSFDRLPEASEREEDLLDMAPHLTDTSRLSCQVVITKDLDGMEVRVPLSTLNFYVDGHRPTPH